MPANEPVVGLARSLFLGASLQHSPGGPAGALGRSTFGGAITSESNSVVERMLASCESLASGFRRYIYGSGHRKSSL